MNGSLLDELAAQERALVLPHFGNDDAWRLGCLIVALARERSAPVAIDIRRGEQQLFHSALEGTGPEHDVRLARKSRVVTRCDAGSMLVAERYRAEGTTFEAATGLDPSRYAAHPGAFPLRVTGTGLVGVAAVSGLPGRDDHDLLITALTRFLDDLRMSWTP